MSGVSDAADCRSGQFDRKKLAWREAGKWNLNYSTGTGWYLEWSSLLPSYLYPVSLATRWLSDFWDQNTALYVISPLASKLEEVCEDWLKELFNLPGEVVAGFVSGSSLSIFCGLAAARYRVFHNNNWDINKKGLNGAPRVRIVAGKQVHGAVVKAIALLGFGIDNVEWVDTDSQGRILPSKVPQLDESTILLLQAGNVSSGSFDPFDEICEKANKAIQDLKGT